MKFTVIVMRPAWFVECVAGFDTLQDCQYVATGVEAQLVGGAGALAVKEAFEADYEYTHSATGFDLHGARVEDYTVLGVIKEGGDYVPWLNGDRP
jgi:hypothetical protein